MNLWTFLLLAGCICIVGAGTLGKVSRKKATKFKEHNCVEPTDDDEEDHRTFLKCHYPDYKPDSHHAKRKAKFLKCKEAMLKHDPDASGWSEGITHLCHWTDEEINSMLNFNSIPVNDTGAQFDAELHSHRTVRADTVNWASAGKVTSIKHQGNCGACYAFAAAAAIESYALIKYNRYLDLSPQQWVDCSANLGCSGGNSATTFGYTYYTAYAVAWSCYPYVGYKQLCKNPSCASYQGITGYWKIATGDEVAMANAIYWYGPVVIAFDVNGMNYYTGGIWDGTCSSVTTNHLVAVIGYGADSAGTQYWIYKNSWGTGWGESGYARIRRGVNKCGIANWAYYAMIA